MMWYYLGVSALLILVIALLFFAADKTLEHFAHGGSPFSFWPILTAIYSILLLSFCLAWIDNGEEKGPCVRYETQMHYNPATKTTMPAKVCTLRGEWVK